jgi:hypothetical protein
MKSSSKILINVLIVVWFVTLEGCFPLSFQISKPNKENAEKISQYLVKEGIDTSYSFVVDSSIYRKAQRSGFTLPRFKVYNESGEQIFNLNGYISNFSVQLQKSIERSETVLEGNTLENEIKILRTRDGQRITLNNIANDVNYHFVEYWAIWCSPCKAEMAAVDKFMKEHPELRINYIKVNWDIQETWYKNNESE